MAVKEQAARLMAANEIGRVCVVGTGVIGAAEGLALGLINRVAPGAEVMDKARELADAIIANAPLSISAIKEMARHTEHLSLSHTLALQRAGGLAWYDRVQHCEAAKEGPRAFAEKRAPVWRGH